ncbi:xanthine dehydrogenase family protein molybdopterin-binding subunit [Saccharobesus litoralis]|uniref:Xanthine dehydrogenase family protein molybdopterin-binding subunit n=1 Tax=Saccharobesus litoralis TaxID=2172099 RepID=A0A2S0VMY5_9ALTE|nr:molybdopterin cofactor-binding domain-containing protein [Saccharobesus litoralis]AWB65450.1 xanthine dehydrogenase family protein molybdopterin-binding subunit [Saccharobesus litoralis]
MDNQVKELLNDYTGYKGISRRSFIKSMSATSGGLLLGVSLPSLSVTQEQGHFSPNAFVHLYENGDLILYCGRCEMGQGISTALPGAVADEMDADWSRVIVKQADGDAEKYGPQNTGGSASIRKMLTPMREAGAAARLMLISAAAKVWNTSVDNCFTQAHFVHNKVNGQQLGYGQLASLAAAVAVPSKPKLKSREEFKLLGTEFPRHDVPMVISGKRQYGVDAKIPNMQYAAITHCPVMGGKLKSVDKSAALAIKGVSHVIEIQPFADPFGSLGGVAVVANNSWTAQQAVKQLKIEWDKGEHASYNTQEYKKMLVENVEKPAKVIKQKGKVTNALANAAITHEATYTGGHLCHAPMEPNASAVWVKNDGTCEIWAATQHPENIQKVVSKYLGIDAKAVTVHVMICGGAFGRKSKPDYVQEAAAISQAIKAPVQLTWTREEDMRTGYYHSINAQHIKAGINQNGQLDAWLHRIAFPSINTLFDPSLQRAPQKALGQINNHPFDIKNFQSESGIAPAHTRIGWYRAVYAIFLGFAYGTFIDELAHKAGQSPIALLNNIYDNVKNKKLKKIGQRSKAVLALAAEKSGYGKTLPPGEGIGIAVHYSFFSHVAMAVHVKVVGDNIQVLNVDCAVDCGQVLNLDGAKAQMEGAVVMGMSLAMHTEIQFKQGAVVNSNFHDYPVLRITDMPQVNVHFIDSPAPATGLGEPGVAPFAPALSNAVFAASGKRYRDLPFKNV